MNSLLGGFVFLKVHTFITGNSTDEGPGPETFRVKLTPKHGTFVHCYSFFLLKIPLFTIFVIVIHVSQSLIFYL